MRLQSVGGLNQQYMANTPVEASRNFPRLLPIYDILPTSMFSDGISFSDVSFKESIRKNSFWSQNLLCNKYKIITLNQLI